MKEFNFFEGVFTLKYFFPFRSSYRFGNSLLFAAWLLVVYTVFSGTFRKWVFGPGPISNAIFLAQLSIPFVFYFFSNYSNAPSKFKSPIFYTLFIVYLMLTAINPMNNTIYHGLFGMLIHLGFWIGLTAYYQRRDIFELEKLIGLLILILVLEVVLGSIQYNLPSEHFLNIQGDGKKAEGHVGNAVRVAGTFSYLGGFQVFIAFFGFLIWALLVLDAPFWLTISVFGMSFYGALISGSRSSMLTMLTISFFSFIYTGFFRKRLVNVILTLAIFAGLGAYFAGDLVSRFDVALENFSQRLEWGQESGESEGRVSSAFEELINYRGQYPIYGIGLGSTYQGANALFGESAYAKEYGYYENELTRIVLEGGFLLLFFRAIVLMLFLRSSSIPLLGQILIFCAFHFSMVIFNVFQGIFFLLGFMIVDRAYYLRKRNNMLPTSIR